MLRQGVDQAELLDLLPQHLSGKWTQQRPRMEYEICGKFLIVQIRHGQEICKIYAIASAIHIYSQCHGRVVSKECELI